MKKKGGKVSQGAIYCEAAESDACRILKGELHRVTSHILDSELPSLQPCGRSG